MAKKNPFAAYGEAKKGKRGGGKQAPPFVKKGQKPAKKGK